MIIATTTVVVSAAAMIIATVSMAAATTSGMLQCRKFLLCRRPHLHHFSVKLDGKPRKGMIEVHLHLFIVNLEHLALHLETLLGHHRQDGTLLDGFSKPAVAHEEFLVEFYNIVFKPLPERNLCGECHRKLVTCFKTAQCSHQSRDHVMAKPENHCVGTVGRSLEKEFTVGIVIEPVFVRNEFSF